MPHLHGGRNVWKISEFVESRGRSGARVRSPYL
jgi:hypothetical protein